MNGPVLIQAQTKVIDSLKQYVYSATGDQQKLKAILNLCEEYKSLDRDTLDRYAVLAKQLSEKSADIRSKGLASLAFANSYFRWGWMDSAIAELNSALTHFTAEDPANRDLYFNLVRQKAMNYGSKSKFEEALGLLYSLVNTAEKYQDTLTLATNLNSIGSIAIARNQPHEALKWHYKALAYPTKDKRYEPVLAAIYVNMADAYNQIGIKDSAEYFIEKGITLFRQQQNLMNLALALQKRSNIYIKTNRLQEAEATVKEMLEVRKQTSDGSMYVDDINTLINFYIETHQVDKAIQVCQDMLIRGDYDNLNNGKNLTTMKNLQLRLSYYEALVRCYKIKGGGKLYEEALEKFVALKDSAYEANAAMAIAEIQTKYEVAKKENTIIQQSLDLTRKRNQLFGSISLLLFLVILGYLFFIAYKRAQRLKMERMLADEKLESVKAVADAKEKERARIAADLHDNLGVQANAILYVTEQLRGKNIPKEELVNDLHDTAKDMMVNLRETLWAMKQTDTSAADIWIRIVNFCSQIGRYYPSVNISTAGHTPGKMPLGPVKGLNTVLIVQEAVNNALRHSNAAAINISNTENNGDWNIVVEDDGKGFDTEAVQLKKESYGLANIKTRASNTGIGLEIDSAPGRGTSVRLNVTPDIL